MPDLEPANDIASISPYLLLPLRPLPVFAAELRQRLAHTRADGERRNLAARIMAAECEIVRRRRQDKTRTILGRASVARRGSL